MNNKVMFIYIYTLTRDNRCVLASSNYVANYVQIPGSLELRCPQFLIYYLLVFRLWNLAFGVQRHYFDTLPLSDDCSLSGTSCAY